MREIEELLSETILLPPDEWDYHLVTEVGTWPASQIAERFKEVCSLVDNTLDPSLPQGIAAHVLRQKLTAASLHLATLIMRIGQIEGGPEAIEFRWAEGWGDIKPWNEMANPEERTQTDR